MTGRRRTALLLFASAFVLAVVASLSLSAMRAREAPASHAAIEMAASVAAEHPVVTNSGQGKSYFDVVGHSADDFHKLLQRAHMIYQESPSAERVALEVVLVLHGPDIEFFDGANYTQYQNIVDLAAILDALGVFDFKMCAASAAGLGLAAEQVPPFIEFVPYGPAEIDRLQGAGYVRL